MTFKSIDFGDGCLGERSCNPDNESLVKFIVVENIDSVRSLHWNLSTIGRMADDAPVFHEGYSPPSYLQ